MKQETDNKLLEYDFSENIHQNFLLISTNCFIQLQDCLGVLFNLRVVAVDDVITDSDSIEQQQTLVDLARDGHQYPVVHTEKERER